MTTTLSLFDRVWNDEFFRPSTSFNDKYTFDVDIAEKGKDYIISADLPGVRKEDINIELKGRSLTISAKKEVSKEDVDTYVRTERTYGEFFRSLVVPEGTSEKQVEASYTDGVLRIVLKNLKKLPDVKTIKIE